MDSNHVISLISDEVHVPENDTSIMSAGKSLNETAKTDNNAASVCSTGIINQKLIPIDKTLNKIPLTIDGSRRMGLQTIKVIMPASGSTSQLLVTSNASLVTRNITSTPMNSNRIPVKVVIADSIRNRMKQSVNTFKLSPATVLKGGQQAMMCLGNTTAPFLSNTNKVALIPAQNISFLAEPSPKKVAVISLPLAKQSPSHSLLAADHPVGQPAASSAGSLGEVIDLVNSPVKVHAVVQNPQTKLVLQPVGLHQVSQKNSIEGPPRTVIQAFEQLPAGSFSSLMQKLSQTTGASSSSTSTNVSSSGQVKFVKMVTMTPETAQKNTVVGNQSVLKSPLRVLVPTGKTISSSQLNVSTSTAVVHLPSSQVCRVPQKITQVNSSDQVTPDRVGQPPKRLILPATCNRKVSDEDLKLAVAHMTKQASLTVKDIQRNTNITGQNMIINLPSKIRKISESEASVYEGCNAQISRRSYLGTRSDGTSIEKSRRPCNCSKSQCLKLYCECFANGEFCSGCNCINCANNLQHEDDRQRAIRACLDRNPYAFHPKIGKSREGDANRQHSKGCHCKRSNCLKNYCECYEAKILCTELCKCYGCKNYESNAIRKSLMRLADAADVRVQQQLAATSRLDAEIDYPSLKPNADLNGKRLPHSFVTMDVVEATNACLLATAEECMAMFQGDTFAERQLLEEYGRCLEQVIDAANRSTALQ